MEGELLFCVHCETVCVENHTLEGQICWMVRHRMIGGWLPHPDMQHYKLKRARKTLNQRRLR